VKGRYGLGLNFATRPARNRRPYLYAARLLSLLLVLLAGLAVFSAVKYGLPALKEKSALDAERKLLEQDRRELERLRNAAGRLEKELEKKVEAVNSVIMMKSFSWTELLTQLEQALPASCHVVSFSPGSPDGRSVRVRMKVAAGSLAGLVKFIDNLRAGSFRDISISSQSNDESGGIVADMEFAYERSER
jgi:Tfp pilus assembly protein PilN